MGFMEAISAGFRNYVNFNGRAIRSEYWFWELFYFIVSVVTLVIDNVLFSGVGASPLNSLAALALFLPTLGVSIRRLHDIDRTGWWVLIALTGIGIILLIVWACMRGTIGQNQYGPDALAGKA